jgi:hypothetical protein
VVVAVGSDRVGDAHTCQAPTVECLLPGVRFNIRQLYPQLIEGDAPPTDSHCE